MCFVVGGSVERQEWMIVKAGVLWSGARSERTVSWSRVDGVRGRGYGELEPWTIRWTVRLMEDRPDMEGSSGSEISLSRR